MPVWCIWLYGKQSFHQYRKVFKPIDSFLSVQDLLFVSACPSLMLVSSGTNGCWKSWVQESTGSFFLSCLRNWFPVCPLCSMAAWAVDVNFILCAVQSSPLLNLTLPTHILTAVLTERERTEQDSRVAVVLAHPGIHIFVCSSNCHKVSTWQDSSSTYS